MLPLMLCGGYGYGQCELPKFASDGASPVASNEIGSGLMLQEYWKAMKDPELRLAWAIALGADALQIAAFPFFAEGGVSPLDSALDLVVAFMLIRLLGWHWAFLPSMVVEVLPGADLFPTWSAALLFVTRDRLKSEEPVVIAAESGAVR
jgi:hypothetical protein